MTGFESSPAWMASVRAGSLPPDAESGPEIPSHAQPRVCIRKAAQENGTAVKRGANVQDVSPTADKAPDLSTKAPDPSAKAPDPSAKAPDPTAKAPDPTAKAPDPPASETAEEITPASCQRTRSLPSDGVSGSAQMSAPSAVRQPSADSIRAPAAPTSSVSVPVMSPPPTSGGYRVPFGYVPGAISVELPKRQRTHKHHAGTAAMPRSYSSLT